jgi:hypothetical protein
MRHMLSYSKFVLMLVLLVLGAEASAQKRLPIIDMHMHARTANHYGPPPQSMCAPVEKMPLWDQTEPWGDALGKSQPCKNPIWSPKTDAEVMGQTIAVMKRRNIIGMLGGKPELVSKWMAADGRHFG